MLTRIIGILKVNSLVLVEWLDSKSGGEWTDLVVGDPEPVVCFSVGWMIHCSETSLVIISNITVNTCQGFGYLTIPRESVKSITMLRDPLDRHPLEDALKK